MKAIKLLAFVAAVGLTIYWWRGRHPAVDPGAKSPNGFVSIAVPDEARGDTVLIFAPVNCPSDAAQRADSLASELSTRGIPNLRTNSYNATVKNSNEADQAALLERTNEVMKAGVPVVFVNGKAKANPTLQEVIAEYGGSRQQ